MKIDGVQVDEKQEKYYQALRKKNPALAKKFLAGLQKQQAQEKSAKLDIIVQTQKEASDPEKIKALDCKGVHNFSLGCLDAYFYLSKYLDEGRAYLLRDRILVIPSRTGGYKIFVFEHEKEDLKILAEMQNIGIIYSINQIEGLPKESKFKEVSYKLKEVFDPAFYKSYQKRKEIIGRPLRKLINDGLTTEQITVENIRDCFDLHEQWVEKKLADPDTFQIMFPRKRYFYCAQKAAGIEKNSLGIEYKGTLFRMKGEAVAVDVGSIQNNYGYGFAGFGCFWKQQNHFMRGIDVCNLQNHFNDGIEYYNCGASLNKSLTGFKTKYPYFYMQSWMYSQIK